MSPMLKPLVLALLFASSMAIQCSSGGKIGICLPVIAATDQSPAVDPCSDDGLTSVAVDGCPSPTQCCLGFIQTECTNDAGDSGRCMSTSMCDGVSGASAFDSADCGGPADVVKCCVKTPTPKKRGNDCISNKGVGKCEHKALCKSSGGKQKAYYGAGCDGGFSFKFPTGGKINMKLGCCVSA